MIHPPTNWLDQAIAWLSPQRGLRRMRARTATEIIQLAYEGARIDRRTQGWITANSAANAEIGPALAKLRQRSRDAVRNNPYGARIVNLWTAYAVGTGITPKIPVKVAGKNRIDDAWKWFVDHCDADGRHDFFGLQTLVARTIIESGECLIQRRDRFVSDGLRIPMQLQVIEPDYLDLNKTERTETGFIIQGVEFEKINRRVFRIFYWLFGDHPGDVLQTTSRGSLASARVPAESILHVYRSLRSGQVRGVPWLAPALMILRDLDVYQDARLVGRQLQACYTGVITQAEAGEGAATGIPSIEEGTGQRLETLKPGMFVRLAPGEEIAFPSLPPVQGESDFIRQAEIRIALALGLPVELLTGDHANVNYSGHKGGAIPFQKMLEEFRWTCFIPQFCVPVRDWFNRAAFAAGEIPVSDYPVSWNPPPFKSADPVKDAQADLQEMRSGLATWDQKVAERGYDPDEQMEEIRARNEKLDSATPPIVLDGDPRKVSKTGVGQKEYQDADA